MREELGQSDRDLELGGKLMPSIREGRLQFDFPENWTATNFDQWSFYRNQFQSVCSGTKAIDILAIEPNECIWIIEVKDYRQFQRIKPTDTADEVAIKVRDSLAALVAAKAIANDAAEKRECRDGVKVS